MFDRSNSARLEPRCFPQGAVQALDQRIDFAAVAFEKRLKSLFGIEPSAQGAIHEVGTVSNVCGCLWRLSNLPQDGGCFYKRARVLGWTFAGKLCERVTQSFGFIGVHRCDPAIDYDDGMRLCMSSAF